MIKMILSSHSVRMRPSLSINHHLKIVMNSHHSPQHLPQTSPFNYLLSCLLDSDSNNELDIYLNKTDHKNVNFQDQTCVVLVMR